MIDDVYGDLNGKDDYSVPQTIQLDDTYSCTFPGDVSGVAGDSQNDTVTASGTDDDGTPVSDSDDATVAVARVEVKSGPAEIRTPDLRRVKATS